MTDALSTALGAVRPGPRRVLEKALDGHELSVEDAVSLSGGEPATLHATCLAADALRRRQVGDLVTYVVNRNINFTNVCIKACRFCAFSRTRRADEAYFLDQDEVVRRAIEARFLGATEVCLQAGLAPNLDGRTYVDLCRAVKEAVPDLHVHAFSPEEIKYGAALAGVSVRSYLTELKDAGLGSLPGTSAEVLDDDLRRRIAPGRITTAEWVEVIETAHAIGIPTTSTMMYGHVETAEQRIRHLALLRSIQKATGGFTEFVPLSFVHEEAPMFRRRPLVGMRAGPSGDEVLEVHALARIFLGPWIRNIQVSWVKQGLASSGVLLGAGVNDVGGTLINESISTAAGAAHGQRAAPRVLQQMIRDAGRVPAERDTRYEVLRTFGAPDEGGHPLDSIADDDPHFGSYRSLSRDPAFRYRG